MLFAYTSRRLLLLLLPCAWSHAVSWRSKASSRGDSYLALLQVSAGRVARSEENHSSGIVLALLDQSVEHADPSDQVLFAHIPKTAGTSIEDAANKSEPRRRWGRFMSGGYMQEMADGSKCSMHHVPASLLADRMLQEEYRRAHVFCVVRDPYERIVSEYSYRLSVHGVPNHFRSHPECTPDGLNFFVQQALLAYVGGQPFAFDCHLLPQHEFIYSGGERWCNDVLKLEEFPDNFNNLMKTRGIEVELDHKKTFSFENRCPSLSVKDLTPESTQMIAAVYREDFRLLSDLENISMQGGDVLANAAAVASEVQAALQDSSAQELRSNAAVTALRTDPFGLKGLA